MRRIMSRPPVLVAVVLSTSLLLGGCAHQTGEQVVSGARAVLDSRLESASSIDLLARQRLPLKPTTVVLEEHGEVFTMGGEKSYVAVLELPAYERTYSVTLTSLPQGLPLDTWIFVPRITLLDEQFKPTRSFSEEGLRSRGSSLERTVFFNPVNAGDRYLVLHGAPLKAPYVRDVQMVTTETYSTGTGTFNWMSGADAKGMVRPSPIGKVEVTVDGLAPAGR